MNHANRSNLVLVFFVCLLTIFLANTSYASGSGGVDRAKQNQYEQGKKTFQRKLACDQCPLYAIELDQQIARDLLPKLRRKGELGKLLSWIERSNVKVYLKKRYKI